jgi:NAD(P)H-hydrate epimerase
MFKHALLTSEQIYNADRATIEGGTAGSELMRRAGMHAAEIIMQRFAPRETVVLCGPGNNGGDGFIIAAHLQENGWPVKIALFGERAELRGDAAWAMGQWTGAVEHYGPGTFDHRPLIVDAIFGVGRTRPTSRPQRIPTRRA